MIFPFYFELENRTPEKFCKLLIIGWSCVFIFFAAFVISAYLRWGSNVNADIIVEFPDDIYSKIARLGISLVVIFQIPFLVIPMRAPLL